VCAILPGGYYTGYSREQKILELPYNSKRIKSGVVTSKWHMRSALLSFKQYLKKVPAHSLAPVSLVSSSFAYQRFISDSDALSKSTTMFHEWIGLLWYNLRR